MSAYDRETLKAAAKYLREQGARRFDTHSFRDARGAALWDAGCAIDPNDGDELEVGPDEAMTAALAALKEPEPDLPQLLRETKAELEWLRGKVGRAWDLAREWAAGEDAVMGAILSSVLMDDYAPPKIAPSCCNPPATGTEPTPPPAFACEVPVDEDGTPCDAPATKAAVDRMTRRPYPACDLHAPTTEETAR